MALVSIAEAFETEVDDDSSRYTYIGVSNDVNDSVESVKASPLCPRRGNVDPSNSNKQISSVQVRRASSETKSLSWLIYVTSTILVLPMENPLNVPADITLNSEQYERLTIFDKEGKAIMNKAHSIVPVPRECSRWTFNVKKNVPSIPIYILAYQNATNNGHVTIKGLPCPKGTLMLKNLQGGSDQTVQVGASTVSFLPMSFQLHYREEGWAVEYPNVGFEAYYDNEKVFEYIRGPSGRRSNKLKIDPVTGAPAFTLGKVRRRITINETAVTEPQRLDNNGYVIEDLSSGELIKLSAEVYSEKDFNLLPLT